MRCSVPCHSQAAARLLVYQKALIIARVPNCSMQFWTRRLDVHGLAMAESQREKLAAFLADNEFNTLASLRQAGHPKHWAGAGEFSTEELNALHNLCRWREHADYVSRAAVPLHLRAYSGKYPDRGPLARYSEAVARFVLLAGRRGDKHSRRQSPARFRAKGMQKHRCN